MGSEGIVSNMINERGYFIAKIRNFAEMERTLLNLRRSGLAFDNQKPVGDMQTRVSSWERIGAVGATYERYQVVVG